MASEKFPDEVAVAKGIHVAVTGNMATSLVEAVNEAVKTLEERGISAMRYEFSSQLIYYLPHLQTSHAPGIIDANDANSVEKSGVGSRDLAVDFNAMVTRTRRDRKARLAEALSKALSLPESDQ